MSKSKHNNEELPANLKHDTMEFAASNDGSDILDSDAPGYEEDEISAEELEALNDTDENEAAALIAEQSDFDIDESNLPAEDWTDDLPEMDDEEDTEIRR
jgi:hypothetical protein